MSTSSATAPAIDGILQLGLGFWSSKTLLSAIELGLFTDLATHGPLSADALREQLGLHQRAARDFFDALVAFGMLEREDGRYRNTPAADLYLDRGKSSYLGAEFEMVNALMYRAWGGLTEALRTGAPQIEAAAGVGFFDAVYADPARLRQFLQAMTSASSPVARALATTFPWERYDTVIDIGCAQGCVPVQLALSHDHLSGGGFDLPPVGPHFDEYVASAGLGDRLAFHAGDFFSDPLPHADVLVMGHILHDWDIDQKRLLLEKAYDALPKGGALIVYDAMIDDDRRTNAFGLLMSLNMLINTPGGFDYTGADCQTWMRDTGFSETYVEQLARHESAVVGIK